MAQCHAFLVSMMLHVGVVFSCIIVYYSLVRIYHSLFIHSTDNEFLDCLLFGVSVNNSTMNIVTQVFWLYVLEFLWGIYLGFEFLGHRECTFSNLLIMISFLSDCTNLHSQCMAMYENSGYSTSLLILVIVTV